MFVLNSTLKTFILCKIGEQLKDLHTISYSGNIFLYKNSTFLVINDNFSVALFRLSKVVGEDKKDKVSIRVLKNTTSPFKISVKVGDSNVINYIDRNQNLISKEWFDVGYNFDEYKIAVIGKKVEEPIVGNDNLCFYSILKIDGTFLGPTDLLGARTTVSRKFGFIIVQLRNGNFNYVNMKTGELLLPETTKITRTGDFHKEQGIILAEIERDGKPGNQYVDLEGKIWNSIKDAKAEASI